ncbi:N/A [soil metagenome]
MDGDVRLRPIEESDLELVARFEWHPDAAGEFQWFGFRMDKAKELERRWHQDGLIGDETSYLAVVLGDVTCAGVVDWRRVGRFGTFEIGIVLFPEHRGHGVGTQAQRQLVDYLFSTTTTHRLQAGTEVDNLAEQEALEHVGFQREGVSRAVYFRAGRWRDSVMYGLLRNEE